MAVIHNGVEEVISDSILKEKWKLGSVYGVEKANKPDKCLFNNTSKALKLLDKHIKKNSLIVLHTDVDFDGVGTTYIMKKTLEYLGSNNHLLLINKDKIHGIQQKHADYFKDKQIGLMIITDSSSNEIQIIKQFNCDVLCIDHHELLHSELSGKCNNGENEFVIVNNTIDSTTYEEDILWLQDSNYTKYEADSRMSCGLVVYELLRVYCKYIGKEQLVENLKLYQWAGTTLFTDAVDTLNERNQWYLDNTVFTNEIEHCMQIMISRINKFKATLDKSYIQYSLAPIVNKAIRAGKSSEVVNKVINEPQDICSLNIYNENQTKAIENATTILSSDCTTRSDIIFDTDVIMLDLSNIDVHQNYYGVIASRICGNNNKSAAVFKTIANGKYKGSFRGKCKHIDYRRYFNDYSDDIYAQGHPTAFGFELAKQQLSYLMSSLADLEPKEEDRPWISIGRVEEPYRGTYHIDSADEFRKSGLVWKIATGNAKVQSVDEILVRVSAKDVVLKETKGKVLIYNVLGFECKAFKPLQGDFFNLYIEYSKEINIFIR